MQRGEVGAEVAAVDRREAVGLDAGMGGDEEVRDEIESWAPMASIAQEDLAGEVGGCRGDGVVEDVEQIKVGLRRLHLGIGDGKLRKGDGRDDQLAFAGSSLEAVPPGLPAGLLSGEKEKNGTIKGGAHGGEESGGFRARQLDGPTQFIHDFEHGPVAPWVRCGLPKLLPRLGWDGLGRFEKGGCFIEFENIARLEMEPIANMHRNGDLTFGGKGRLHELIGKR